MGLAYFSPEGAQLFKEEYNRAKKKYGETKKFHNASSFSQASFEDMIQEIIDRGHPVQALEVTEGWMEVHSFEDYKLACEITE